MTYNYSYYNGNKNETNGGRNNNSFEINPNKTNEETFRTKSTIKGLLPTISELKKYAGVMLCGVSLWGTSWFLLDDIVLPGGYLFQMSGVVIAGYILGITLEKYTTINPVVGMTLMGAIFRNLGPSNYLDNSTATQIDFHLRRIYPVIILTKGPLGWNWEYIKNNCVKVFSLATLPWVVECLSVAFLTHILFGYPWYWGLHLGAILSSVSPAVVVPTVMELNARGLGTKNKIAMLIANAGGLDTAFTEGMFGVINSAIFYPVSPIYRIIKAILAIFIGIVIGIVWGILCDVLPDHEDVNAPTIRCLHIFAGGVVLSYMCAYFGWGGVSGVAIMVCAGAAATRWSRRGWPINNNPVSEVYKLLWTIFEPMLFTLSGYFLDVSQITWREFGLIVGCLLSALFLRMVTAFLVSLANELSIREGLFVAVTWVPKAIVEAVLVRVASDSLWRDGVTEQDRRIAAQHSNIIVIAILITSTLGSALTTALGPILLSEDSRVGPDELYQTHTLPVPPSAVSRRSNSSNIRCFEVQ